MNVILQLIKFDVNKQKSGKKEVGKRLLIGGHCDDDNKQSVTRVFLSPQYFQVNHLNFHLVRKL